MSIFYNSSGLITRGFGEDHKIITRGLSKRVDLNGFYPIQKSNDYLLDIFVSIIKKNVQSLGIFVPIKKQSKKNLFLNTGILKQKIEEKNIFAKVSSENLKKLLREI